MGYLTETSRQKMILNIFITKVNLFLVLPFQFDLFINKVRKLEVAMVSLYLSFG